MSDAEQRSNRMPLPRPVLVVLAVIIIAATVGWLWPAYMHWQDERRAEREFENTRLTMELNKLGAVPMVRDGRIVELTFTAEKSADTDKRLASLLRWKVQLGSLETIRLDGTDVTDEGLMQLTKLSSLNSVFIRNTQITDDGIREFRRKLSGCHVHR